MTITNESISVAANDGTVTLNGSVNRSTAWFGDGTWNLELGTPNVSP